MVVLFEEKVSALSLQDARDSLRQVLPMMSEVAADSTDSDSGDVAQQPQLQEQLSQNSGSSSELRLYYQGNNKVCSIALTPGPSGNTASSTLWVGLKQKVEFFVGCNASNKHEVLTEKVRQQCGTAPCSLVTRRSESCWSNLFCLYVDHNQSLCADRPAVSC